MAQQSNEKEMALSVPYIAHEAAQARAERMNKRLIIALIVAIALLFATNLIWILRDLQYDYVGSEVNVDTEGEGNANYIGQDGEIYNGKNNSENESESQENDG